MNININTIQVMERIRKETGDLKPLIDSIREHGLINPITVMENGDGYVLIAGYRRLQAVKALGNHEISATVLNPMDADKQLKMEIDENEARKSFTIQERLAYADKIKVVEQAKARQRMSEHARDGHARKQGCLNWDTPEGQDKPDKKQRTDDIVAQRAGFSSRQQYERAAYVADASPELLDQIDAGEKSISGAYSEAKQRRLALRQAREEMQSYGMGMVENSSGGKMFGHTGRPITDESGWRYLVDGFAQNCNHYLYSCQNTMGMFMQFGDAESDCALSELLDSMIEQAIAMLGDHYSGKYTK